MHDCENALAAGRERQPSFRIEPVCVNPPADRDRGDQLAAIGIHNGHHLVVATGEQPPMFSIHGQPGRFFARSQRPARLDLEFVGIECHEFTFVFNVDEDFAFLVTDRKLWLPIHLDSADHLTLGRVDGSDIVAPAVESEDPLAGRIKENRVRVFAGLNLVEHFQRVQVKNTHGSLASVADEPAAELRRQGNAMHAGRIRNIAHGLSRIRIDHDDVRGPGNVQTIRGGIERQIVPASIAAEFVSLDHVVARSCRQTRRNQQQRDQRDANSHDAQLLQALHLHQPPPKSNNQSTRP